MVFCKRIRFLSLKEYPARHNAGAGFLLIAAILRPYRTRITFGIWKLKQAIIWPYWRKRLHSDRFDRKHGIRTPQPQRKLWEIFVPWNTRGDMRLPLDRKITLLGSLRELTERKIKEEKRLRHLDKERKDRAIRFLNSIDMAF